MIKKVKYILGKKAWKKYQILIIMMIAAAAIDTVLTYVIYPFATLLLDETASLNTQEVVYVGIKMDQAHKIAYMAALIACAYVIRNAFMLLLNKFKFSFLAKEKANISNKLFTAFAQKKYSYFVENNTATIQRICVDDVLRFFRLLESLLDLTVNALTMIAILVVLAKSNIVLTLLCVFLTGGLSALINRKISHKIRKMSLMHTEKYTQLLQIVQQFVGNIKAIFVTHKQDYFAKKFSEYNECESKISSQNSFLSTMSGYITNAIMMGVVFGYISVIALLNNDIREQLPILALFALGAMKIMPSVSTIAVCINNIRYNEIAFSYVYNNIIELNSPVNTEIEHIISVDDKRQSPIVDITIDHIYFRFEDSTKDLFSDLSLQIPNKKMVAFIGGTGSGKTTLADIILGLQIPYKGTVMVAGKDISQNRLWWADQIGYIPQEIYLNEATILENVAFGIDEKDIDEEHVKECLQKACLLDFVEELPLGLKTMTGENGVKLSGGQKQRIGIARALYRNPTFLVLDEATSALDYKTEKNIMDTINELAGEMTILIIAHRLSTIEKCDYVYKIEDGKIELINKL